eukprot:9331380-Pyramimonas_sp.AAC.1
MVPPNFRELHCSYSPQTFTANRALIYYRGVTSVFPDRIVESLTIFQKSDARSSRCPPGPGGPMGVGGKPSTRLPPGPS